MITDEILANQISIGLQGETIEYLNKLPDAVKLYILDLAFKYYSRRMNIDFKFQTSSFTPVTVQAEPNEFLGNNRTSQDLGKNDRYPGLQTQFDGFNANDPSVSPLGRLAQGSQLGRELYDYNDYTQAESATQQLYGTSINYEHVLPQTQAEPLIGPDAMPYPNYFDGRPDNFEFSASDGFTAGIPADPSEY
jgi:hypothetical protein